MSTPGDGDPDRDRHQHRRLADHGRKKSRCHRDHAERQDRLCRQLRLGHGDPDRDGHRHRRPADHGRKRPDAIAITPDGKTAYVGNGNSGTVTPIATATNTAGPPITVGSQPLAHRDHAERQDRLRRQRHGTGTVTPISTATNTAGPPITVGNDPCHRDHAERQNRLRRQLRLGHRDPDHDRHQHRRAADHGRKNPRAIAITPDGKTAYVANQGSDTVTPISTATNTAAPPIAVGNAPYAIAIADLARAHRHQHHRWRRHHPRACGGHGPGQ